MAYVKVEGRATFAYSQNLREFGTVALDSGVSRFVADVSACLQMDSTFIGVLAMIALQATRRGVSVNIGGASERLRDTFSTLGLDRLFVFQSDPMCGVAAGSARDPDDIGGSASRDEVRKTMLDAHKALGEVAPENKIRFQSVVELLEKRGETDDG